MPSVAKIASIRWCGSSRRRGVLAAPRRDRPAVLELAPASRRKLRPAGRSLRSPAAIAYGTSIAVEPVQQHPGLRVALVASAGSDGSSSSPIRAPADPYHRRGEAAPVQAGGERQQDVLGALHGGAQRAEQQRPGRGGAAGQRSPGRSWRRAGRRACASGRSAGPPGRTPGRARRRGSPGPAPSSSSRSERML